MQRAVRTIIISTWTLGCQALQSAVPDTADWPGIIDRQVMETVSVTSIFEPIYSNPAMAPLRRVNSYNSAGMKWEHRAHRPGEPYNPATGSAENHGTFSADTYLKHGNSTLWGFAGYTTGKIRSIQWCETSDYHTVYPYVMADATGGDLNKEIYSFGGGISSGKGRWHYGGALAYKAGLYYRTIDPRPRNVTGLLNLSAGAGIDAGKHIYAIGIRADKYKQTNAIEFMSELGSAKIYHLTGLGTTYSRFTGSGESTYYTGWRYGASADVHPRTGESGVTAHTSITRFILTNIIADLNKLPMAQIREMDYQAEAGWKGHTISANIHVRMTRRLGNENIFGDAQSGSYPQIATLTGYAHNRICAGTDIGISVYPSGRWSVKTSAHISYSHDNQVQASANARRIINNLHVGTNVAAAYRVSHGTLLSGELSYIHRKPLESMFTLPENGVPGAIEAATAHYLSDAHRLNGIGGKVSFTQVVSAGIGLHISATWELTTIDSHATLTAAILF